MGRKNTRYFPAWALFAAAVMSLGLFSATEASAGPFGRLQLDIELERIFEEGRMLPEYRYYYSGTVNIPDGIIGIDRAYTLKTSLWGEIDPKKQSLREMVGWMRNRGGFISRFPNGMWILDDKGKRIGIWYSELSQTTVRMHDEETVEITTPGKLLQLRNRMSPFGSGDR